jgi:hypothetical protein
MDAQMYSVLKGEGVTEIEFLAITAYGPTWTDRATGYAEAEFPILPDDSEGSVFALYGATYYDVFLVDKKGRLVTGIHAFSSASFSEYNRRIEELNAE